MVYLVKMMSECKCFVRRKWRCCSLRVWPNRGTAARLKRSCSNSGWTDRMAVLAASVSDFFHFSSIVNILQVNKWFSLLHFMFYLWYTFLCPIIFSLAKNGCTPPFELEMKNISCLQNVSLNDQETRQKIKKDIFYSCFILVWRHVSCRFQHLRI
jgi:hypothetical protein